MYANTIRVVSCFYLLCSFFVEIKSFSINIQYVFSVYNYRVYCEVIPWRSVVLHGGGIRVPGKNYRPAANHLQTLSYTSCIKYTQVRTSIELTSFLVNNYRIKYYISSSIYYCSLCQHVYNIQSDNDAKISTTLGNPWGIEFGHSLLE